MIKRFQELLTGDTTDPVNQYVMNCILTYGISFILSVGLFSPEGADTATLLQAMRDCIVPSAVTLTFSVVLQNHATVAGTWAATHNGLTILSAGLALFYMLAYVWARSHEVPYLTFFTITATTFLYWVTLRSIDQVLMGAKIGAVTTPKPGARP